MFKQLGVTAIDQVDVYLLFLTASSVLINYL